MRKAKYPRSIILAVALYLVAAISAAVTQQNWEFSKFTFLSLSLSRVL
jgi:hypothetical protein